MARRLNFHWNLRQLMAAHEIWKTTELIPLLAERGVRLSTAQVYRLVTDKPERLSLKTLTALCDILSCTPADLIDPYVEASSRKPAVGEATVVDVRPRSTGRHAHGQSLVNRWNRRTRQHPVLDRGRVQVARGLLIPPTGEHLLEHLFLGVQQGSATGHEQGRSRPRNPPRLIHCLALTPPTPVHESFI